MVVVWLVALPLCVAGTSFAGRRAVTSALRLVDAMRLSPALIGVTVMAIGTDLPEIANSLVSTASDHGDINVGDSMGSVITQITLVLGILCLVARDIGGANRQFLISIGLATVFASTMVWVMVGDGELSHLDGLILVLLWIGGTAVLGHGELTPRRLASDERVQVARDLGLTLLWLAVVGGFAVGVVQSFLQVAETFGIPEFIGSFIALSVGTSLPELVVDWTALRRGASSMAIGGIFGSSFVDATLSIGIGPLVFGSLVSSAVTTGVAVAAIGVLAATILTVRAKAYDWRLGVGLLTIYVVAQVIVAGSNLQ